MWVPSLDGEDSLEEGVATHSSILDWAGETGELWSKGSKRIGHDLAAEQQ